MNALKNCLLEHQNPKIQYIIPESGYFGCINVNSSLNYDKIVYSLHPKKIKIFNTSQCFLKEYRCNNYFRITISNVNEKQITKNIPTLLNIIEKHMY